ncbi:Cerato-platanin domain-containing protein [Trichoderma sp. SZMC 28014]
MVALRFIHIAAFLLSASAEIVTVTTKKAYDDPSRPLNEVTCWRKNIGFMPNLDWKLQRDAVAFIGIPTIKSTSSRSCLTCWEVNYNGVAKYFLALDGSDSGYVLSVKDMLSLTGDAKESSIHAEVTEVSTTNCGLSAMDLHGYDF